ncbi:phosphoribosylformylglycinamidine synthase II [Methanobacterium sp. MZ-A1]|uniref:Phosphoribosylformylglycinamidine synthase subunit PurL n=2 Tax=Methanobacteriaceae TaxID=2159 RepID=A0A2H4VB73_9EURY|nr:phosphoribosylformylglycinamidine synthase II [Methanobacterium subterraneum]AUB57685.1 phosphoribosylformylglycinamidine synthase II [Methanobacterium sp. MZ-A1]PKL74092.1 MAG: phosphoribosylformylglycinamidine synthase subunit PurL [Methanobacteriales archaeon HGW-Methanobacteriales-2]
MTLTNDEMEYIKEELGREPNPLEYGMLDIMFSEHCSYKSSRPILKLFPTEGEKVIMGPGDDAGIVELTDDLALVMGMESHNHPSAVEPYGGAGTGIGGIIRDIISMGAMPVALLDSLRFGPMNDQRSRYIFEYVVKGISDYGNRVGIPTVGGEVEFEDNFKFNPLVNVVCAGIVRKDEIVKGIAPNVGDVFVLMGGRTGRDGIHGVTFASEELTSSSELESRPAVQVGDPFTKKQVMEATFEALEKVNVQGLKDLGGGGLTCCISEMADKSGNGALMELTKVPLREEGMTPYEIMLSESQERMVFVVHRQDVDGLLQVFNKHELPYAVIGQVTSTGRMVVTQEGEVVADLPTELLADPPLVEREAIKPEKDKKYVEVEDGPIDEALLNLLSSPNLASKKWVYRQYDHEVQIRTVVKPGDDAAVLRVDDEKAFTLTSDCNSIHCYLDPYHGGAGAVAEAIRNVVAMGSKPLCMVDCLNFGNPEKPEVFWQFKECVQGMSDLANRFQLPVTSGNVSFYNETEGVTVNPSPVVSVAGVMNLKDIRTMEFKNKGDKILIIGTTRPEMDGSEYHKTIHGFVQGEAPQVNMEYEYASAQAILELIQNDENGHVTAVHDLSAGGLGVALAEMIIKGDMGANVDLSRVPGTEGLSVPEILFSESHARYLVTVTEEAPDNITSTLKEMNVPFAIIGTVGGDSLQIDNTNISVAELKNAYQGVIENFMA